MSEQTQLISVSSLNIVPVEIKPPADILLVVPERSSKISYIVGKKVSGKPAVPGVVGRGRILAIGKSGDTNYQPEVPAIDGNPGTPEVPDTVIPLDQGTIEMTDEEWANWKDQEDTSYRLGIVAKRLGFTEAK